mmetsp:Transcript_49457/g.63430  ORF Transcript_49457/g.63430 Transcript_49457/m.63430 type:complete len:97 (+) Transcript_49457:239-529(+)
MEETQICIRCGVLTGARVLSEFKQKDDGTFTKTCKKCLLQLKIYSATKITCICGCVISRGNKTHIYTKRHIELMKTKGQKPKEEEPAIVNVPWWEA